ncbi:DUF2529 domain-containing protein [Bacillaceae bacterium Marseille-Q3522]|nr:DUF2529 domain-containing protein [Bacillaceae bacterium Marseille-Q3522]
MLKMFSTQMTGLLKRLLEKNEYEIEDSARLLAQAAVGDGTIYLYGTQEMKAIPIEALEGAEPFPQAAVWNADDNLELISEADRFMIISRFCTDVSAGNLAKQLNKQSIPFVAISTVLQEAEYNYMELADVSFDLGLKKGMLPDEAGNRYGYPAAAAALMIYHSIKFTFDEILSDQ